MSQSLFRRIIAAVAVLIAVVIVHDIWAKRTSEKAVRIWTDATLKEQDAPGWKGVRRSHDEVETKNRETHRPKTWLF